MNTSLYFHNICKPLFALFNISIFLNVHQTDNFFYQLHPPSPPVQSKRFVKHFLHSPCKVCLIENIGKGTPDQKSTRQHYRFNICRVMLVELTNTVFVNSTNITTNRDCSAVYKRQPPLIMVSRLLLAIIEISLPRKSTYPSFIKRPNLR